MHLQVKKWFRKLLVPVTKQKKLDDPEAVKACEVLARIIGESPTGVMLAKHATDMSMNEISMELLYMIV